MFSDLTDWMQKNDSKDFFALSAYERYQAITRTMQQTHMTPDEVERDVWQCWAMQQIFALNMAKEHFVFKGSASLERVHGIIRRKTADMDVGIDRNVFHDIMATVPDPLSGTQARRIASRLDERSNA